MPAYLNSIVTAVPEFDVHKKFIEYGPLLLPDAQSKKLFSRMARRAQIDHRYSFLQPHVDYNKLDTENFYSKEGFPDTHRRMKFYERHAFSLARQALDQIDLGDITHLLITTCTGFYAPGLDLQIINHYGLSPGIERTVIGFMGCYAALNALKLARHIVRSEQSARVAILNLELCTLHLKQSSTLEEMLSFLIFADGCSASIVSATPEGLELQGFATALLPDSSDQITWQIGGLGFDMNLSGRVPATIAAGLPLRLSAMLDGQKREDIVHWAVHPGGRSVLDAVRDGAGLLEEQLTMSRDILRRFGNMSSATIMFVLHEIMKTPGSGGAGLAMAFGPGLTVESMRFAAQMT
jgi:predicted naringenin-chalcone synthase